jgi:2-dehydropantoate 2-reductase
VSSIAVLGPGAVGGALAVRLAHAGHRIVCVAREPTAAAIAERGLGLESAGRVLRAQPEAVSRLEKPVDLLLITVKAFDLGEALGRVDPAAVARGVAVSLLNGLEHMALVRAAFGPRVAAGSIGRMEAYTRDPVTIVQLSARPLVRLGSDELAPATLAAVAGLLEQAGADVRVETSEKEVLWEKVVRLAPLAAATCATARPLGAIRTDPAWRDRLRAAVEEACATASAEGVAVSAAAQWEMIETMPATLTTSAARDLAAARPSELDAIVGAVVRAGARTGVSCSTLEGMLREIGTTR